MSAEEINQKNRKPFSPDELKDIGEKVLKGSLVIMRRPPWPCLCGNKAIRNFRYIGDIDDVAEWEATCEDCGRKICS